MDDQEQQQIGSYLLQISALLKKFEQQSEQLQNRNQLAIEALQRHEQTVQFGIEKALNDLQENSEQTVSQHVFNALKSQARQLDEHIDLSMQRLGKAHTNLLQSQKNAAQFVRYLSLKAFFVFVVGFLFMVVGSSFYINAQLKQIQKNQVSVEKQKLLSQIEIANCDDKPCVRMDNKLPHYEGHGDYILLSNQTSAHK